MSRMRTHRVPAAAAQPRRDAAANTHAEIERLQAPNALDLVSAIRPGWLVLRGRDTLGARTGIRAYLGATRLNHGHGAVVATAAGRR